MANINVGAVTLPVNGSTSANSFTITNAGTGGINYTNSNSSWISTNGHPVMTLPHGENKVVIDEKAALEVKGRMIINGIDLEERLSIIENLLNIPTRDANMEEKYEKLRNLSNQYNQALEEYKTWERLQNSK